MPPSLVHGTLLGYSVSFTKRGNGTMRTVKTAPAKLEALLTGLQAYSLYEIQVCAFTAKGCGPKSRVISVITDEDVPLAAPAVTVVNQSSSSLLVSWHALPSSLVPGVLRGFHIWYKPSNYSSGASMTVRPDALQCVLRGLLKYTPYEVQVAAFTRIGDGPKSHPMVRYTAEDVPSTAPLNARILNKTSSSIDLRWDAIPIKSVHGVLLGYKVSYGLVNHSLQINVTRTGPSTLHLTLAGLMKHSSYWITVSGFTSVGEGPGSIRLYANTEQDVPSAPPPNVRGVNGSSTSIRVSWDQVPPSLVHGTLLGYSVSFTKRGNGTMRTVKTAPAKLEALLTGLQAYSMYEIQVCAFTAKGFGPKSRVISVMTDEDVPSAAPTIVGIEPVNSTAVIVQWTSVSKNHLNGVLKGYVVTYSGQFDGSRELSVRINSVRVVLGGISPGFEYKVRVAAFTRIGHGPRSAAVLFTTAESPNKAASRTERKNILFQYIAPGVGGFIALVVVLVCLVYFCRRRSSNYPDAARVMITSQLEMDPLDALVAFENPGYESVDRKLPAITTDDITPGHCSNEDLGVPPSCISDNPLYEKPVKQGNNPHKQVYGNQQENPVYDHKQENHIYDSPTHMKLDGDQMENCGEVKSLALKSPVLYFEDFDEETQTEA
ncbi:neogenin-like [Nematostella vectensis]|uniref:neogenin-like n=1 Tax=Nematostella vectensis TaxID=45351 RepID=UPI0020772BAC|nr:neogenin-like [Nematostella vectensis]